MTLQSHRAWLLREAEALFWFFERGIWTTRGPTSGAQLQSAEKPTRYLLASARRWERLAMRPNERRGSGQSDFFKVRLDLIVDMGHPSARLAATIDWRFLEERFEESIRTSLVNRGCREG